MKKLILLGSAFLFTLGFATAQSGWGTKGAHDDFASTTQYSNGPNGEGLYWFETTSASTLKLTRTAGSMDVAVTNAGACHSGASCYPLFGVQFGTDNSNNPYTIDLSSGADITLNVENTGSQLVYVSIQLKDVNDVIAEFEPNVSDVTPTTTYDDNTGTPNFYYHRKALNGFTLAAGATKTITIDLSSVPGAIGGLTAFDVDGSGTPNNCDGVHPATCPETAYKIDASKIKDILFMVNFGDADINLSEGDGNPVSDKFIAGTDITAFSGTIKVYDFKVGDVSSIVAGVKDAVVDNSLSVYPNPADESLTVSFKALTGANVSICDITGNKLMSTTASAGDNNVTLNTSGLVSGMYILNIETENGVVARKLSVK